MTSAITFVKKNLKKLVHPATVILSLIIIFILGPFLYYNINFMGRVYPNIYVAGINVGGKYPKEAAAILAKSVSTPTKISLVGPSNSFELDTKNINLTYDYIESADRAFNVTRTGNYFLDTFTRIHLLVKGLDLGLSSTFDKESLTKIISITAGQVTTNPVYPTVEDVNGTIQVNKGSPGSQLDIESLDLIIGRNLSYANSSDIVIPLTIIDPTLNDQEVAEAKIRSEKYLNKSLTLKFEGQSFEYTESDILKFIDPRDGFYTQNVTDAASKIAASVNRDSQNSKFEFNGSKVTEFQPALDGIELDSQNFKDQLTANLNKLADSTEKNIAFDIPTIKTKPEITIDQVNNLGIKELIGRGNSTYFHSIPGRVFNVNLAASRINGTLIKPGDTFSFNQILGDVSKFTGYQQAYIISGGRTVLGDGGGVCQVSTTLFRAVLNAGLPINERAAHAYRVGYYEQNSPPGIDATVYAPSPDFKFTNDTPGYVLIEAKNDPRNYSLSFEIYGTNDGRVATLSKPIISNYSPPLPTVYQDDPTLPAGTLKQTDFAAAGSRVTFNYSVIRAGEQIYQKTFVSNYQPWAAVYLRGTATK